MISSSPKPGCSRTEAVSSYVLNALPASETASMEAHVATCSDCRSELEALRGVVDAFGTWPADMLRAPASLWGRLEQRIAGEKQADPLSPSTRTWSEPEWEDVAPGISCQLLATDAENDRVSMLVRLAPGTEYPPHRHAGVEELHLLDGELWIDDAKLYAGDYNRAEPGSADQRVWSESGCTCVLITSTRDALR